MNNNFLSAGMYRCPFNDCKSKDIVETDGGVSNMVATMHKGRMFDGNQTSLAFKCKSCGESFVITYQIHMIGSKLPMNCLPNYFQTNLFGRIK